MNDLAVRPEVLIADEPVSMLNVSIRLDILNLLLSLKDEEHWLPISPALPSCNADLQSAIPISTELGGRWTNCFLFGDSKK